MAGDAELTEVQVLQVLQQGVGAWLKHGGDTAWVSQSRRSSHRTPLLLTRLFGVPLDCSRQDRPICDSEPPCFMFEPRPDKDILNCI